MPQSLSNCLIHIIFSTKHRQAFIDEDIESKLFGYIGNTCKSLNCPTIAVGGFSNHVHIFCNLGRSITQSDLVKKIKTSSSKWIKTQGPKYANFYWQDGYAIFSVNQSGVEGLSRYIRNQREHHTAKNFKKE